MVVKMMVICGIDKKIMMELQEIKRPNEDIDQTIKRCINAYQKLYPDSNIGGY
jgi:hypothetical protein